MELPTRHQIEAAHHLAGLVGDAELDSQERARCYGRLNTGGLMGSTGIRQGEALLLKIGLCTSMETGGLKGSSGLDALARMSRDEAARILMALALDQVRPMWLATAVTETGVRPELIPTKDLDSLHGVFPEPSELDALMGGGPWKADPHRTSEIGALGEGMVMDHYREGLSVGGRPDLASHVVQVSQVDDRLGYDVAGPTLDGVGHLHLEVKTTTRRSEYQVILSRNESEKGAVDPCWALVFVRLAADEESYTEMCWCPLSALQAQLPVDRSTGRWRSVAVQLPSDSLLPGVPLEGVEA